MDANKTTENIPRCTWPTAPHKNMEIHNFFFFFSLATCAFHRMLFISAASRDTWMIQDDAKLQKVNQSPKHDSVLTKRTNYVFVSGKIMLNTKIFVHRLGYHANCGKVIFFKIIHIFCAEKPRELCVERGCSYYERCEDVSEFSVIDTP